MVLVFGFSFCLREGVGVFLPPLIYQSASQFETFREINDFDFSLESGDVSEHVGETFLVLCGQLGLRPASLERVSHVFVRGDQTCLRRREGAPEMGTKPLGDGPTTTTTIFEFISRGPIFHFWGTPG